MIDMATITTPRLILRPFRPSDVADVFEYAKLPDVGPSAGWQPHKTIEDSQRIVAMFMANNDVWAIVHAADDKVIGSIGLHEDGYRTGVDARSIGYVISPYYQNQGYAKEAVNAILDHAFVVMGYQMVSGYHFPFNVASKKVLIGCGFEYEGTLKKTTKRFDGMIMDHCCYLIEKDQYKRNTEHR